MCGVRIGIIGTSTCSVKSILELVLWDSPKHWIRKISSGSNSLTILASAWRFTSELWRHAGHREGYGIPAPGAARLYM